MSFIYKRNSGTDLALATSWSDTGPTGLAAAAIPSALNTVQFDSTSLGGSLTNALTCSGIVFNSATAAVTFSGTVTLGAGGWTNAATNNLQTTISGTMAVGSNDQTWTLYRTTANQSAIVQTGPVTGSATIILATAGANKGVYSAYSTASTFAGVISIGNNIQLNTASLAGSGSGAGFGNAATIQIDGSGSALTSSSGTGTFVSAVVVNNSWSIGGAGTLTQAVNVTGTTTFGSGGAYTLTTSAVGTLTGAVNMAGNSHAITATSACTVAGALTLADSPYSNVLSGAAGALTISGATTCGSGSHTIRTNGAGNVSISNTFDCGTGNQTFQTLSGAGTMTISNTLTMGAGSHTFNASTAAITISGAMTGTNGFTKTGANDLIVTNTGGSPSLTGTVTVSAGELYLGTSSQTGDVLTGVTLFDITSTSANLIVRSSTSFTFDNPFQGDGNALFLCTNASGITISGNGSMPAMNNASATIGSGVYASAAASHLNINEFPTKLAWYLQGASPTGNIYYINSSPVTHSGANNLDTSLVVSGTVTAALHNNNGSTNNYIVLSGSTSVTGTGSVIWTLRGSNEGNNEVSGVISNGAGTIAITKNDSGKWILSGANSYTGATTLTAGTLTITQGGLTTGSLGGSSSSAAITLTSGTLNIDTNGGAETFNKPTSTMALSGATLRNTSGANTLTTGAVTMNASTTMEILAGSLSLTAAIGGAVANGLSKNGDGSLYLNNTGNGYLGPTTINAGSIYITKMASAGVASSLGAPASSSTNHYIFMNNNTNLIHIGTTADVNNDRPIIPVGVNPRIDIWAEGTGSGSLTIASNWNIASYSSGTRTFSFNGDSPNTQTYSGPFTSASLALIKNGTTRWNFTNASFGPATITCYGGILGLGSANRTVSGTVNIYYGSQIELLAPYTFDTGNISINLGGTITAELTGSTATITIDSSCTEADPAIIIATNTTTGSNSNGGNSTINGVVDVHTPAAVQISTAGYGKVLGNGTVTVGSTGTIRTKAIVSSSQRGQCRYANLSLVSGSNLKIGYAD